MKRELAFLATCSLLGCATLAGEAGDSDAERPNALAGPFRLLGKSEIDGLDAPYVLNKKFSDFREPTVLDLDPGESLGATALYAVVTVTGVSHIERFLAADGRSFDVEPNPVAPVLSPDLAWEGAGLDAPEAARVGSETWLYYSAEGGIGLSRSTDGVSFEKQPAPVLAAGGSTWEGGKAPRAPAFLELGPGEYRLFYEANGQIGEARSSDGVAWERIGDAPLLGPGQGSADEPAFDGVAVGDPEVWRTRTAEGRVVTRVYYTGRSPDGSSAIGLAARYGDSGKLTRAPAPAFAGTRGPRSPAVVPHGSFTLLFLTERAGPNDDYPAIAVGIAPATRTLPVEK
ncbi:MAG: hypothetical protein U0263_29420 [Polyangiaceae bacterium]